LELTLRPHPPSKGTVYPASHFDVRQYRTAYLCASDHAEVYRLSAGWRGFANTHMDSGGFYRYRIDYNGQITLNHMVIPNGKMPMWLPRIGIDMVLDSALNAVKWYGRGPQENYPDRKSGYKIGVYNTTVEAMYEPYLLPEDFGLRTDNRFVEMTDEKGVGLRFTSDRLFNFNAYNFTTDNLSKAKYTYQLQPLDGITFNFDYATSGVGCTARSIFNQYRVEPQQFEQQIVISILK